MSSPLILVGLNSGGGLKACLLASAAGCAAAGAAAGGAAAVGDAAAASDVGGDPGFATQPPSTTSAPSIKSRIALSFRLIGSNGSKGSVRRQVCANRAERPGLLPTRSHRRQSR